MLEKGSDKMVLSDLMVQTSPFSEPSKLDWVATSDPCADPACDFSELMQRWTISELDFPRWTPSFSPISPWHCALQHSG